MENYRLRNYAKFSLILIGAVIVLLIAWTIYYSITPHVVSVVPSTGSISTITPYISVNLNYDIASNGLSVTANSSLIRSYRVNGKTLTINFSIPLNANQRYTITVSHVYDTAGKEIKSFSLSFVPSYVAYNALPPNQQKAILQSQSEAANNQPPSFIGTDILISNGLTTQQVQYFEQEVNDFAKSMNIQYSSVNIDQSSVVPTSQPGGVFGLNLVFSINNVSYKTNLQYSGLTTEQVIINNYSDGTQLFEGGSLN